MITLKLQSIDAWRDCEGGWTWNDVFSVADIEFEDEYPSNREIIGVLRRLGYLTDASKGRVTVEDTNGMGEIYEVQDNRTGEPLFALVGETPRWGI